MDDVVNALKLRFPLLTSLRLYRGPGDSEALASFMGILLAAIAESRHSSFCFVFPRKGRTAPLAAILYSLGRFAVDFPELTDRYAERTFGKGQRVKLIPGGKIYVFGGLWPGHEGRFFRLELLNGKGACTWPVKDILRIEPTHRKMPRGDFSDRTENAPLCPLDSLIGTRTFGNTSLAVNHVLYLGGRAEFEEFLTATSFVSLSCPEPSTAASLMSPGVIDESGQVRHRNNYQVAGEPFVALGSRIEHIAACCRISPPRSKVVIIDGARRITEFASFDAIAETQNMIIVAEADEEEKLHQLFDRGCKFWWFSHADLELGQAEHQGNGYFNGIFQAARNADELRTDVIGCENAHLEKAGTALEHCQRALEESEGDETQLILGQLYGLLTHCAALPAPPEADERARLRDRAGRLSRAATDRMMWLPQSAALPLGEACAEITQAIEDTDLGDAKGRAITALLSDIQRRGLKQVGFVARSASNRTIVTRWINGADSKFPVLLPSNAADAGSFDALICTAWPSSVNFIKLARQCAAPLICLVAYPFERRWFHQHNRKQRNVQPLPNLDSSEKSELLALSGDVAWPVRPQIEAPDDIAVTEIHKAYDFEERITGDPVSVAEPGEEAVPTKLVELTGSAYAFLTESARLPVITDLVSGTAAPNHRIPRRRVAQLRVGDFLIFRDGGRRDVIQALADTQLGSDAPVLRERAAKWLSALRESGLSESALLNELEEVNCPRTLQTVRAWLNSDSMIGPQTRADLDAIAYALGDPQLLDEAQEIWQAIKILRSEHLSAGMRLTRILLKRLPEHLAKLHEGATRIEIDNATSAWIVQVEKIAEQLFLRPRSRVNTILWRNDDLV